MTDAGFYSILGILAVVVIVVIALVRRRRAVARLKLTIEERWGKPPGDKYKAEDMQAIAGYYANYSNENGKRALIDDITWSDLDMDDIFKRINNTGSTVGEEYLYKLLREPVTDEAGLKERNRIIEYFRSNPSCRRELQLCFARLGKRRSTNLSDYFTSNGSSIPSKTSRYVLQLALLLVSPLVIIVSPGLGILMLIVVLIANTTTYYKAKNEREVYMESLSFLVNMINYSKKIARTSMPGIEEYMASLRKNTDTIKGFSIKSFYQLFYQTGDVFLEPVKVLFMIDLIAFGSLIRKLSKYKEELRQLYETLGFLDSMISAASYRESLEYFTVPVFKSGGSPALSFKDAYHPLIRKPVANSIEMSKSALITGSNASGKSTFLKTAAINAILAQTVYTCLAREYRTSCFMIYTSMALKDNLLSNESYYIAEIKSLKRVFDHMSEELPILCMIDEVLRGTNTIERIAASSEVLRRLAGSNCLCIAATHDIELVSILKESFDNYHFQESFQDDNIVFDYKIYPGKSTTRNAIKLLRLMGYSEDVVSSAEERAERFAREGKWVEI